jgi:alkylated DNA repair dioxygenase AlkB
MQSTMQTFAGADRRAFGQRALFGYEAPVPDASFASLERIHLDHGAWVDVARGWLAGHASLFEWLLAHTQWQGDERLMYQRRVVVPRLRGQPPEHAASTAALAAMRAALDRRYETAFIRTGLALYRDGDDGVAWHGDAVARQMEEALAATVSLGAPRKFLLRPTGGGASVALSLGWGDLLVMGGSCQRCYQHAIPKVARAAARIVVMFRPRWIAGLGS